MIQTKIFAEGNHYQLEPKLNDFLTEILMNDCMVLDLVYAATPYKFTVMVIYGPPEYSIKYKGIKV